MTSKRSDSKLSDSKLSCNQSKNKIKAIKEKYKIFQCLSGIKIEHKFLR